ncbi:MAG: leucyl aminopeptidase [bacterium]
MINITLKNNKDKKIPQVSVLLAYKDKSVIPARIFDTETTKELNQLIKEAKFSYAQNSITQISVAKHQTVILVGLGEYKLATLETLRRAGAGVKNYLQNQSRKAASILLPTFPQGAKATDVVQVLAEGIWLADYKFDKYKKPNTEEIKVENIKLVYNRLNKSLENALQKAKLICAGVNTARDLQNDTSDEINPAGFAKYCEQELKNIPKVKIEILDEKELAKLGANLILIVGRASAHESKMIVISYKGNARGKENIALIGKGVTYDTGGVNLKPSSGGNLEEMHTDMAGAAVVLETIKVAAQLGLKKNLTAIIPLAENALGGNAYKPSSVIKAYNGTNVEILNTDAEGRLLLADAIAYAEDKIKPTKIIDLATLTGAVILALGFEMAAIFSNDETLNTQLIKAGEKTAEKLWRLPLSDEYRPLIESQKADIKNAFTSGSARDAQVIMGAAFLEHFIKNAKWAHLDIAGAFRSTGKKAYEPQSGYGNGYGVRLLIDYLS